MYSRFVTAWFESYSELTGAHMKQYHKKKYMLKEQAKTNNNATLFIDILQV